MHKKLGPGFVEKIYQKALALEFKNSNLKFEKEKEIKIYYDDKFIGLQILDFMVENEVIVELKATSEINNIHVGQIVSYLKACNKKIGLVLNFAKSKLEIKRVKN